MPDGYLVQLGNGSLDAGDAIVDPLITFTTDQVLGAGNWIWSGTWNGQTFTNTSEPGEYILATDGNVYFVPDFGAVDTITSASVTSAPPYTEPPPGSTITGTPEPDDLDGTADGDFIDGLGSGDTLDGLGGDDTILGGGGEDTITGGSGADSLTGGDGADSVEGGSGDDELYGGEDDDALFGEAGSDLLVGGSGSDALLGGDGTDTIYGDAPPGDPTELLQWSLEGGDGTDVTGGFMQNTGTVDVTVSITNDGALTAAELDTTTTQYTETGEPFGGTSALELSGDGGSATATVSLTFADTDDTDSTGAVEDLSFRLNDIDTGAWVDTVTINAFDALGNPVSVTITPEDAGNTTSGSTVTSGVANGSAASQSGSVLVEIDGPLSSLEIIYGNDSTGGQRAWISDVAFTPSTAPDGADTLDGGAGADVIFGGGGNDAFIVADGDEAYGEDGDDVFTLADLGEAGAAITIDGGEAGESTGDTLALGGLGSVDDVVFDAGNPENGTITLTNGTVVTFSNIENIICFTPGTAIATPHGDRAIEDLRMGDLVLTRDHGPRAIRWIGASTMPGDGDFAPVEISAGVFGCGSVLVSPQHRMLFTGPRAELLFGEREVLVAAKHLVDGRAVRVRPRPAVTYIHIMFDDHEIIRANGLQTESFFAADQGLTALDDRAREELFVLFPELRTASAVGPTARRALRRYEAALLS
ncbi:MAG: Hint domain-containing protein [Pseudomonadota bacterium]